MTVKDLNLKQTLMMDEFSKQRSENFRTHRINV